METIKHRHKILIVGQFFISEKNGKIDFPGGTERYVYGLAKQLQNDGYEIIVLSTTTSKYETGWKMLDGLKVFMYKTPEKFYDSFIDFLSFVYTLKLVRNFNPDIVHVISVRYHFAIGTIVASKVMNKKVVYTMTAPPGPNRKQLRIPLLLDYFIFSKIIGWSDIIISLSKETKKEVSEFLSREKHKNVVIIPSFFIGNYYKMMDKNCNSILSVGRLVAGKGVDFLIKALYYVKNEIPDIKLRIVGKGLFLNYLKDLVAEYSLKKNVIFEGHLDEDKLVDKYSSSEIFVMPSYIEGMPMVLLEAMNAGLPIIAFDIEPCVEVLDYGNYGILVKKGDVKSLSQKIIELLKDKYQRDYYSRKSIDRSKEYLQETVIRKIERIYSSLIESM